MRKSVTHCYYPETAISADTLLEARGNKPALPSHVDVRLRTPAAPVPAWWSDSTGTGTAMGTWTGVAASIT